MKHIFILLCLTFLLSSCTFFSGESCKNGAGREYYGVGEECSRIFFLCEEGTTHFQDECGCGCEIIDEPSDGVNLGSGFTPDDVVYCNDEDRDVSSCNEIYQPVCGYDEEVVLCFTEPCPPRGSEIDTFSNSCYACQNKNVDFWVSGECGAAKVDKCSFGKPKTEGSCDMLLGYYYNDRSNSCEAVSGCSVSNIDFFSSLEECQGSCVIEETFCTQDVKECSDGSFVSRDPKNSCEFRDC